MTYQTAALTGVSYTRQNFLLRKRLEGIQATHIARLESSGTDYFGMPVLKKQARPNSMTADPHAFTVFEMKAPMRSVPDVDVLVTFPLSGVRYEPEDAPIGLRIPADPGQSMTDSLAVAELTSVTMEGRLVARTLDALIEGGKEERFEDGMESNLSLGLRVLFRNYSEELTLILGERLDKAEINPRVLAEILHTLGHDEEPTTKDWRFSTLVKFLSSPSPLVRDAAAIGLSYLNDRKAIPYLREAIKREASPSLKEDMRVIAEELEA